MSEQNFEQNKRFFRALRQAEYAKPTCLATNQVVAPCVNTEFWLDKITWELRDAQEIGPLL